MRLRLRMKARRVKRELKRLHLLVGLAQHQEVLLLKLQQELERAEHPLLAMPPPPKDLFLEHPTTVPDSPPPPVRLTQGQPEIQEEPPTPVEDQIAEELGLGMRLMRTSPPS